MNDIINETVKPTEADLARDLRVDLQHLDRIIGDVVMCKFFHIAGYRAAVRRAIAAEDELARLKTGTYCAYCGHEEPIDGGGEKIAEHIRTCEKHPMRAVEAKNAHLQERLALAEKIVEVTRELDECEHDDTPCRIDRSGFCQEHFCNEPCIAAKVKDLLAQWDQVKEKG